MPTKPYRNKILADVIQTYAVTVSAVGARLEGAALHRSTAAACQRRSRSGQLGDHQFEDVSYFAVARTLPAAESPNRVRLEPWTLPAVTNRCSEDFGGRPRGL